MLIRNDLRRTVGQLLIMGFDGTEAEPALRSFIKEMQPGGVILFARNLVSAQQCYDLVAECRKQIQTPPFTCIDLEGGLVDRFRQIIAPAPSEAEIAATGSKALFRKHGELLGTEARALGFNTDFAPVSDLGFERSRNVLGTRTVSADPKETVRFVSECLRGLKSAGVLGCGKHYPGLGEGDLDSHHALPVIDKPWNRLWAEDLFPYRALHKQMPFIMVAHAAYPAVTGGSIPASLSAKWMTQILRKKIGYRGIILSDDLEMGGALAAGSIEHAAVETLRAGADMFLVCRKEDLVRTTFEAVLRQAEHHTRFARRIAESAARITEFKKRSKELKKVARRPTDQTVNKLRKQIDTLRKALEKASK